MRPGSALDREAFRRANSVYVPGLVEPMLPEALSNRACSLVPGEDRLTVTVELEFEGAKVRRTAFHRSVIRSDARLDYPRVDRIFAGAERAEEPWAAPLAAARTVAAALADARERAGRWRSSPASPSSASRATATSRALLPSEQTESHRLIEFLMIAANEAVAGLLEARKLPALFRVHEPPDPPRVERLLAQLASLGVPDAAGAGAPDVAAGGRAGRARPRTSSTRRCAGAGTAARRSRRWSCARSSRRTTRRATSATTACARARYCHFTSPIRRYPDLVCHRALLSAIGFEEPTVRTSDLGDAAEWCSRRERDAMAIERTADNVARAFLLERRLFEEGFDQQFEGEVTGLINAGAFIALRRLRGHARRAPPARLVAARRARHEPDRQRVRQAPAARRPRRRAGREGRRAARPRRASLPVRASRRAQSRPVPEVGDQRVPVVVVAVLVPEVVELAVL